MSSTKTSKYDILRKPLMTEKSSSLGNGAAFLVHPKASKIEIREAVERIYEVKVDKVRVINSMGKMKRVQLSLGRQAKTKKAYITLRDGSFGFVEGL